MPEPEHIVRVPLALQLKQSWNIGAPLLFQRLVAVGVAHIDSQIIIAGCSHERVSHSLCCSIAGGLGLRRVPGESDPSAAS